VDVLPARRVDRVGAVLLAQADSEHLRRAALYPSAEGGVRLDPVYQDHRVRLVGVPVHKDLHPGGRLPEHGRLHRGPNGTSDLLLAHTQVPEHLCLPLGGRGPVTPHRRHDEGFGARLL
jgi:hypothetical protein